MVSCTPNLKYTWNCEPWVSFNFTKSDKAKDWNLSPVEKMMDKKAVSSKYVPIVKKANNMRIALWGNCWPIIDKLAFDRWKVYQIDQNCTITRVPTADVRAFNNGLPGLNPQFFQADRA